MTDEERLKKWEKFPVSELNILFVALKFGLAAKKTKYDYNWDDEEARRISIEVGSVILARCHPRG